MNEQTQDVEWSFTTIKTGWVSKDNVDAIRILYHNKVRLGPSYIPKFKI
jgi:hypothetical protein